MEYDWSRHGLERNKMMSAPTRITPAIVLSALQWSGLKLDVVADRTVTGEDSWLLKDECRKTPMIVLSNAWENRVIHSLGTRYPAQSNRSWPWSRTSTATASRNCCWRGWTHFVNVLTLADGSLIGMTAWLVARPPPIESTRSP